MNQEIEKSPILVHARALQSEGVLAWDHQHPLQFGEPITDNRGTPMCVQYMGVRSLRKEFAAWMDHANEHDLQLMDGFSNFADSLAPPFAFLVAASIAGFITTKTFTHSNNVSIQGLGVALTGCLAIAGTAYLVSHWRAADQRDNLMISTEIAYGNAQACCMELSRRGRTVSP